MATTTWDPSNKSPSLTLSGGNLTATCTAAHSANLVRATNSQSSGKYYCEHTFTTVPSNGDEGFGLCTAATSMSSTTLWLGHDGATSTSVGNYNGLIYLNNGSFVVSFPPMTAGSNFGFAVDFTNKKLWYWNPTAAGQSGGEWNGDVLANQNPALNVGGIDMSVAHPLSGFGTGTAFFPAMDLEDNTAVGTTNFGASAYAILSTAIASSINGFNNWDGSSIAGGSGVVNPPHPPLPKIQKRRTFIKGWRFPKRVVLRPLTSQVLVKGKPVKPWKRRPIKVKKPNRFPVNYVKGIIVPTRFTTNPPWNYGGGPYGGGPYGAANYSIIVNLQPNVPAATPEKRDKRETYFKPRKQFKRYFAPKRGAVLGQHANPFHPPIAAGITKKIPKWRRRIYRWKVLKKLYPLGQVFKPGNPGGTAWMYGAGPYGGGLYGAAGQLFTFPAPVYPPDGSVFDKTRFWGYAGGPYGGGPYGSAGQVLDYFNSQDHIPSAAPSRVPAQGNIRVAQPYVSVVRSAKPTLAGVRKAAPSLQQVRKKPPNLTD